MTPAPNMNEMATSHHAANQHWWHHPATGERLDRNPFELLMLVQSEIAECMEGERKSLMDDKLPHRPMGEVELADVLIRCYDCAGGWKLDLKEEYRGQDAPIEKGNIGEMLFKLTGWVVALGDAIFFLRGREHVSVAMVSVIEQTEVVAAHLGYDVYAAVAEKRAYNATRADHKAEARLAANGKKW